MIKEELLNEAGLSDKEAKAYLAILEMGSSTIKPISARAGIKRTSVYNFIDHLIELGLVSKSILRGRTYYQATSPARESTNEHWNASRSLSKRCAEFTINTAGPNHLGLWHQRHRWPLANSIDHESRF